MIRPTGKNMATFLARLAAGIEMGGLQESVSFGRHVNEWKREPMAAVMVMTIMWLIGSHQSIGPSKMQLWHQPTTGCRPAFRQSDSGRLSTASPRADQFATAVWRRSNYSGDQVSRLNQIHRQQEQKNLP